MSPAGRGLLHPVAIVAVAVLVVNDHLLKPLVPGLVTGKLSDVAGLVYAPLLGQALVELVRPRVGPRRAVLVASALAVALGFAAIKLDATAAASYVAVGELVLGEGGVAHTRDPSDLFALPAVLVAIAIGRRRDHGIQGR